MKNKFLLCCLILSIQGCSTDPNSPNYPISQVEVKPQTYTYLNLTDNKSDLWKKARNYIASAFGNSKAVLRVEDDADGTLIGKGLIQWKMLDNALSPFCYSNYDIRFVAKENKARLQLELLPGVPAGSECVAWQLPSRYGYNQILMKFSDISSQLENSLRGEGKIESMSDF